MISTSKHKSFDMYKLYDEYKETIRVSRKALKKRQEINANMRKTKKKPYERDDYNKNVSDITHWNSMISDMEKDMREMEMSMDFDDRELLHRDYYNMKSMILNKNSYEGELHIDGVCSTIIPCIEDVICNVELQDEVVELIDNVLNDRQKSIVHMYFWKDMTQKEISDEIGIAQQNVSLNLQNALKSLEKCVNYEEMCVF